MTLDDAPAREIEVHVFGPGGLLCSVAVATDAKVFELQQAIEAKLGIPPLYQRLFHDLRELCPKTGVLSSFASDVPLELLLVRRTDDQVQWLQQLDQANTASLWLRRADEAACRDREVVLTAVLRDGRSLEYAAAELKACRHFALEVVTQRGWALGKLAPELRGDREVVLAAVSKYGGALSLAAPDLQATRHLQLLAPEPCELLGKKLCAWHTRLADREVALSAVCRDGWALQFAAPHLRADREIVLSAVGEDGGALLYASPELLGDRAVVLAAVGQRGVALEHAAPELRSDRDVVGVAVTQSGWALQHADPQLQADRDIVLKAVAQHGLALEHAAPALRANREVVVAALGQDIHALELAAPCLRFRLLVCCYGCMPH